MNQKHWGRFVFLVGVTCISNSGAIIRADDWRPKGTAYQVREIREECSVYRSVFTSTKELLNRRVADLKNITDSTQQQYKSLTDCRQKNGISEMETEEGQRKTAELCAENYDLWLLEGTHLITAEEEVEKLRDEVSTLEGAVSRRCLPTLVAKLR